MKRVFEDYYPGKSVLCLLLAFMIFSIHPIMIFLRSDQEKKNQNLADKLALYQGKRLASNKKLLKNINLGIHKFNQNKTMFASPIFTFGLNYDNSAIEYLSVVSEYGHVSAVEASYQKESVSFVELAVNLANLMRDYKKKNNVYPQGNREERFRAIGLSWRDWQKARDDIFFDFSGSVLYVRPEQGIVLKIKDMGGHWRILPGGSDMPLIYNIDSDKWYLGRERITNEVDFATIKKEVQK